MKKDKVISLGQHRLIEASLPLVGWTVRRYFTCKENVVGLSYDDLFQEGCIGLCKAVSDYDSTRGEFDTFAVSVIRNHLIDYCRYLTADVRNVPTCSLEEITENGWEGNDTGIRAQTATDAESELLSDLCASRFLETRKRHYDGSARMGIEALELKVLGGYGVTDIAKQYKAKPNLVGAWMSRAIKRIRADISREEIDALGVENAS